MTAKLVTLHLAECRHCHVPRLAEAWQLRMDGWEFFKVDGWWCGTCLPLRDEKGLAPFEEPAMFYLEAPVSIFGEWREASPLPQWGQKGDMRK